MNLRDEQLEEVREHQAYLNVIKQLNAAGSEIKGYCPEADEAFRRTIRNGVAHSIIEELNPEQKDIYVAQIMALYDNGHEDAFKRLFVKNTITNPVILSVHTKNVLSQKVLCSGTHALLYL